MTEKERRRVTRSFVAIVVVAAAVLAVMGVFLMQARHLGSENRARIADIQQSRVISCRQTYESIRQVFRPFFPPKAHRTAKQAADLAKFNHAIDSRKRNCIKQTTTP